MSKKLLSRSAYRLLVKLAEVGTIKRTSENWDQVVGYDGLVPTYVEREEAKRKGIGSDYLYRLNATGKDYLAMHGEPPLVLSPTGDEIIEYLLCKRGGVVGGEYDRKRPGNTASLNRLKEDGALEKRDNGTWRVSAEGEAAFARTVLGSRYYAEQKETVLRAGLDAAWEKTSAIELLRYADEITVLGAKAAFVDGAGAGKYAEELRAQAARITTEARIRAAYTHVLYGSLDQQFDVVVGDHDRLKSIQLAEHVKVVFEDGGGWTVEMAAAAIGRGTAMGRSERAIKIGQSLLAAAEIAGLLNATGE